MGGRVRYNGHCGGGSRVKSKAYEKMRVCGLPRYCLCVGVEAKVEQDEEQEGESERTKGRYIDKKDSFI